MTPEELLAREPETVTHSLNYLVGYRYDHIPEARLDLSTGWGLESPRVEVKVYKHFDFDERRYWRLCSVWLDNIPVMICCNAGREGDDYHNRYLLNKDKYKELITHVITIQAQRVEIEETELTPLDINIVEMTKFYGDNLDGHFSKRNW